MKIFAHNQTDSLYILTSIGELRFASNKCALEEGVFIRSTEYQFEIQWPINTAPTYQQCIYGEIINAIMDYQQGSEVMDFLRPLFHQEGTNDGWLITPFENIKKLLRFKDGRVAPIPITTKKSILSFEDRLLLIPFHENLN
jgi:hypothetical protein